MIYMKDVVDKSTMDPCVIGYCYKSIVVDPCVIGLLLQVHVFQGQH
jgi:hypothetical protein